MEINIDKATLSELNCIKVDLCSKPTLIARTFDSEQTLVIVVDMVEGFVKEGALSSLRIKAIVPEMVRTLKLLPNAKKVFIRDQHTDQSIEMKWYPPHCISKKESALIGELAEFTHIDVPKNSTNGIFSLLTALPDIEKYHNILVLGCCTDICILQLTLSLRAYLNEANLANTVNVIIDCVETFDAPMHQADLYNTMALRLMENAGIILFKKLA